MDNETSVNTVWVFVAPRATFPSGVFKSISDAENWISKHKLTGILTEYPVGQGLFDWAIGTERFKPKSDKVLDAEFIGKFTTASAAHYHYEGGSRK